MASANKPIAVVFDCMVSCKPLRDPKDEPYLNLAIATKTSFIVSRDNDLLDLMRWDQAEGREFQKRFRFLRVVTPEAFLTETL